jgi:hypothetical protein
MRPAWKHQRETGVLPEQEEYCLEMKQAKANQISLLKAQGTQLKQAKGDNN